jgi:type I restriction enzyme M protein
MIGAIIGDTAGSMYEFHNIKTKDFVPFEGPVTPTDDSMMTLAVAAALLKSKEDYSDLSQQTVEYMQRIGEEYPYAGYGGLFSIWLESDDPKPYGSYGNGAAMRVSPCRWAATSMEQAKWLSRKVTEVTHNHPEGIKGAEATTVATYMALHGSSIEEIREVICRYYYDIDFTLDEIRVNYRFNESCQGTVPQALEAFFESTDFEDALKNAISIGGDSDTMRAITCAVAGAYYGVPKKYRELVYEEMDELMIKILEKFEERFGRKDAME